MTRARARRERGEQQRDARSASGRAREREVVTISSNPFGHDRPIPQEVTGTEAKDATEESLGDYEAQWDLAQYEAKYAEELAQQKQDWIEEIVQDQLADAEIERGCCGLTPPSD